MEKIEKSKRSARHRGLGERYLKKEKKKDPTETSITVN